MKNKFKVACEWTNYGIIEVEIEGDDIKAAIQRAIDTQSEIPLPSDRDPDTGYLEGSFAINEDLELNKVLNGISD